MYTSDMQELLASTVDDYDPELVYNLDDSETTNFAVFTDDTLVIEEEMGANTLTGIDDENYIYVFENADTQITTLSSGSVVAYLYGEDEMLLFKAESVALDGTTATVTGTDLEIDEVFAYMKLENTGDTSQITVDDDYSDEGITYEGLSGGQQTRSWSGDITTEVAHQFNLKNEFAGSTADGGVDYSVEFKGSLKFSLSVNVAYYISLSRQFIKFKTTASTGWNIEVTGEVNINGWKLGRFEFSPVAGVFVRFEPQIKLSFSGKVTFSTACSFTVGMQVEHRTGGRFNAQNLSSSPKSESSVEFEGEIFIGLDLHPSVSVVSSAVAKLSMTGLVGVSIKGTLKKGGGEQPLTGNMVHECKTCIDGDLSAVIEISFELQFLKSKYLTLELTLLDKSFKLADFYYSNDYSEMGWGECPHYLYRLRIMTLNKDGSRATKVPVVANNTIDLGSSNSNGLLIAYLPKGNYTFRAEISGQQVTHTELITNYCSITLTANEKYYEELDDLEKQQILPDSALTGSIIGFGKCGAEAYWSLYSSGFMKITGSGSMVSYYDASAVPWALYKNAIKSLHVTGNVSGVGQNAFSECKNLRKVVLDDCVTYIGTYAFYNCTGLKEVKMPVDISSYNRFNACANVEKIHYTYGTTGQMFTKSSSGSYDAYNYSLEYYSQKALTTVIFDEGITSIGDYAFYDCTALKSIDLLGDCPTVGSNAFYSVTATVNYPADNETYTEESKGAFGGTLTWVSYVPDEAAQAEGSVSVSQSLTGTVVENIPTADAVYDGENRSEVTEDETVFQISSFEGLVPNEQYVMLALVSLDVEDLLSADNLLFIDQAAAAEDGTLSFRYVQRVPTDEFYVFVCGASDKSLVDAQITLPELKANGEAQAFQPTVTYEDQTLVEGLHYVIVEGAVFTDSGTYTATLRGINQYSGLNTFSYTVGEAVVQPTLTLKAPTLEFKDMITVNAMFTAENIDDVVEMGMITYTEQVAEWSVETANHVIPGTTYDVNTGRYIATSQGIHAKYLGDTVYLAVYAKLSDGTYAYSKLAGYSPVQYATSKLNGTDTALKQLVVAMLNYGAAAQTHFDHNIDALANASLTAEQLALPEGYRSDMVSTVAAADATKQGTFANNKGFAKRYPSISFEGAFCINYFFTPNYAPVDGITLYYWNAAGFEAVDVLSVENASGSLKLDGEGTAEYRGDITGIAAKNLSEAVYVAAVYSDGTAEWTSGVLGYSIGAYCASQATKGGTIADLAMATAVYGYQAKQYFGS